MSQLGRISGPLLKDNLIRNGIDLAFQTNLLYLNVTSKRVGIKTASPTHDLHISGTTDTNDLIVDTQAKIGATPGYVVINASGTISTEPGPLHIRPSGANPIISIGRMTNSSLIVNDNYIASTSNQNIVLDPSGAGTVELQAITNVTGNLNVSGNIVVDGNLKSDGTIYIGDSIFNDTVVIAPDFTQSIIPGDDLAYDLGKSDKRWVELDIVDTTHFGTVTGLNDVKISDQLRIDGTSNTIFGMQSNEDVLLNPDTGITYIERTKWQDNAITNLNNTPITFANTDIGYVRFVGTNAFVLPIGPTDDRRVTPEVGETRWNTDLEYLETFDGGVWNVSTGGGATVTQAIMQDLADAYTLMLG
jgi:hypothetical protein